MKTVAPAGVSADEFIIAIADLQIKAARFDRLSGSAFCREVHAMRLLQENQVIRDGDYRVERFLGEGFFAEVWRVEHHIMGRQALKIFKTPGTHDEVKMMLEEARLLTKFGHRNIVRVYDAGNYKTATGTHGFFTMEYIESNLEAYRIMHKELFVPVPVAVDILRQTCLGLSLAHLSEPPLVHRDIKPQNILVEETAGNIRVCVSDFGLAKHVNPLRLKASTKGTPCYRAPECYDDAQAASPAADVWSLGLTIYLMLTARFPYTGADLDEIKPEYFKRRLYPASRVNSGVDERLDHILTRALAVDPAARYPHVMALLDDLEAYRANQNRAPQSPTPPDVSAEQEARQMVARAVELSRSDLREAANLLEKAINRFPAYRHEHQGLLEAWRNGKRM